MTHIWMQSFPEGSWESFHSTELKTTTVRKVFARMISPLFQRDKVSAACIFHQNKRDYGFDFYPGLLFEFFLKYADIILEKENHYTGAGNHVVANLKIYIAERGPIDTIKFQKSLQTSLNQQVGAYHQKHRLPPDNFCFQVFVYVMPAFGNPFVQVSDMLSYMVRGWLNGFREFSPEVVQFLKTMKKMDASKEMLKIDVIEALNGKNRQDNVINLVINRKIVTTAPAAPAEVDFLRMLLSGLPQWVQETGDSRDKRVAGLVEKLMRRDHIHQMAETDQIRLAANTMISRTREFTEGAFLVHFLQRYIEKARAAASGLLSAFLNRLEVQAAVLYLGVNNHLGHFPLNDACVKAAEAGVDMLRRDPAFWPLICDFYNNMAVSLHNVFDFSQAIQRLHAHIEFLEIRLKDPFTGAAVRCYEIGALFGSYAQTLVFDAHCSFFRSQNTDAFHQLMDAAEYYSCLAMEHFDDPADHERQITYQIHFNLQGYILTGDKAYLEKSAALLKSDGKTEEAFEAFVAACPERSMLNAAYRVSACLKHVYLSGTPHPETPKLTDTVLKNRDRLPPYHPVEQVLAYLTMIETRTERRKHLRAALEHLKFPPNIVNTIQGIMQLQVAFDLKEPISLADIRKVTDSLTPDIEPQWRQYGLLQVLQEYTSAPDRWHVGPMEVLPFNYC
jgi:CHASE3 domain sensor protein